MANKTLWMMFVGGLSACGGNSPTVEEPTYHADIAPLFAEQCVSCHSEGGIGPMALDTPEAAAEWASVAAMAVENRTMPPFYVTDDGTCGEWDQGRQLSVEEIEAVRRWADAGAPAGDAASAAPLPEPSLPVLTEGEGEGTVYEVTTPDFVPMAVGGDLAAFDEYRCFEVTNPTGQDVYLTGYDVVPGNAAIVHHVIGSVVDMAADAWSGGGTNAERAADLSDDGREGWPCFSGAGDGISDNGAPINWAPGQGAVPFPDGVGLRLGAGESIVLQVHYNLADPATAGQSDQSTVRLRLADAVEREAIFVLPDAFLESIFTFSPEEIPPGESAYTYRWDLSVDNIVSQFGPPDIVWPAIGGSAELIAVLPHMHERGTSIRMNVIDDDGTECAVNVENWDFNWQRMYFYEEPWELVPGDRLRIRCTWDTSADTEPVLPGWGTRNEMCLMGLVVVP